MAADRNRVVRIVRTADARGLLFIFVQHDRHEALVLVGDERNHLAALPRPEPDSLHAVAERRINRWMRILERTRHDTNFLELLFRRNGLRAEIVGRAKAPLSRIRHLPEVAINAGCRLRPELLYDLPIFVEHGAVTGIGFGPIGMRRSDVDVLAEGLGPARSVAAGKACKYTTVGEVIEHRDVFGKLDWVDDGEVHAELADPQLPGVLGDEVVPKQRVGGRLDAFHLHVLLGHTEAVIAKLLGILHLLTQAIHQDPKSTLVGAGELNALAAANQVRDDENRKTHCRNSFGYWITARASISTSAFGSNNIAT